MAALIRRVGATCAVFAFPLLALSSCRGRVEASDESAVSDAADGAAADENDAGTAPPEPVACKLVDGACLPTGCCPAIKGHAADFQQDCLRREETPVACAGTTRGCLLEQAVGCIVRSIDGGQEVFRTPVIVYEGDGLESCSPDASAQISRMKACP